MKISIPELAVSVRGLHKSPDCELEPYIAEYCGISERHIRSYQLEKRSIDARRKPDVKILYRLSVELDDGIIPEQKKTEQVQSQEKWHIPEQKKHGSISSPIIVGTGPAGLFAAYVFALAGCKPVIIDRGFDVIRRKNDIDLFFQTRELNTESNFLYGEGGAGTWSDGKLFTRVRDVRMDFVMNTFTEHGANPEILYYSHPHVGSDKLPEIISSIRKKIEQLGGSFLWGNEVTGILSKNGECRGVVLKSGEKLEAPAVLAACGHSARTLIQHLISIVDWSMKGFQIGCRMEHPQEYINRIQFGNPKRNPALGAAEYNFSSRPSQDNRIGGATTFCMCPGGEIIPAVCEVNRLCTNGMSNSARDGFFANSALITTVEKNIFETPQEAFRFLDTIEKKAFETGGGGYSAPMQTAAAFISGKISSSRVMSSFRLGVNPARLDSILPEFAVNAMRRALKHFDSVYSGFIQNGVLIGTETRVSSPVRFLRNERTLSSSMPGLYIAGEGAGMAGGITSSAIDGVKLAEAVLTSA